MAKIVTFNNKQIIEPGAYARVVGAVEKPIEGASFGNVLIIDTGAVASAYSYGAGVSGEHADGQNAIYRFDDIDTFQKAMGGGVISDFARFLFKPSRDVRVRGVSSLYYVRAAETASASVTFEYDGGASNGGDVVIDTVVEGTGANGANTGSGSSLGVGFGVKMEAGTLDTTKFVLKFYRGSYQGTDATVSPAVLIDGKAVGNTTPILIVQSAEFASVQELQAWADSSALFQKWFYMTSTPAGTGAVTTADLTANSTLKLFAGGTQTFNSTHFDTALELVTELDYTFLMTDLYGAEAAGSLMVKAFAHINVVADYEKFLMVPGGTDSDTFNDPTDTSGIEHSIQLAGYYNSAKAFIIHGAVKRPNFDFTAERVYSVLYATAMVTGRMAGVPPQVPITWLDVDIIGVTYDLKKVERELAIQRGVIHFRYVQERGGYVIGKDITSKQDNTQDIYQDGTSPHGSIMRISSLLNKGIVQNIRRNFIAGQNVNTSSPQDIKAYIETYLQSITAQATSDNLIISFQNVQVQLLGADYQISYSFVPNGPIDRIFITGFMLPVNISA